MSNHSAIRYHDISVGHRVVGHEGKCRFLHGHNYRIWFEVRSKALDSVGRVVDFSVIKWRLCQWLEDNLDHQFLAWDKDPEIYSLTEECLINEKVRALFDGSLVIVPFNPTAENIAEYLVEVIGPSQLIGTDCELFKVTVEETRKCSCSYTKGEPK